MQPQEIQQQLQAGLAHHQAGRLNEAEAIYYRVLAAGENADALHLLGMLEAQRGKNEQALLLLHRSVTVAPKFAQAHLHLAQVLASLEQHELALTSFTRAIELEPRDASTRSDAAISLMSLGRLQQALEQLRVAADLAPSDPVVLANYGFAMGRSGRLDEAIAILSRAIASNPQHPGPWLQYSEMLWRRGHYDAAVAPARKGISLGREDSRSLVLLGNALQTVGELTEAAEVYRRAATLDLNNPDAQSNLALTLLKMGEADESLRIFERVVDRWPDHTDALANRSLALLTLGNLRRGFKEYEARWNSPTLRRHHFDRPRWEGDDLGGKTILLVSEQGFGDTVQFIRYAPMLTQRGARTLLVCPADLKPLMKTVEGVEEIYTPTDVLPKFDMYAPLGSLPGIFDTMPETIPNQVPYIRPDPARVEAWQRRLAKSAGLKVGIAWAGNPAHQNDRSRSAQLADFAPLGSVKGVSLFSLQKGPAAAQIASPPAGMQIVDLSAELRDFSDTAALIQALDLVIAVDTSVVHVAGALAAPVWTMLPRGPDWRWMLHRDDSPWYPTMRLFRQTQVGDWQSVFERAAIELAALVTKAKENL